MWSCFLVLVLVGGRGGGLYECSGGLVWYGMGYGSGGWSGIERVDCLGSVLCYSCSFYVCVVCDDV